MKIRVFQSQGGFDSDVVAHGFFGRQGGVSKGIYESLNCGIGSDDAPENVAENRKRVCEAIGAEPENLLSLYQVHGSACLKVEAAWTQDNRPEADAYVTRMPGLALGVLTADCAPVLFYGRSADGPVIGAAHAGWKGALGSVLENTLQAMRELGAEHIHASIGPCIQKRSYEVSLDFYENFCRTDENSERFFGGSRKSGRFIFDLPGYCAGRLGLAGVGDVLLFKDDTYSQEHAYFSYRRATHRSEPDYGRQISVIMIKP